MNDLIADKTEAISNLTGLMNEAARIKAMIDLISSDRFKNSA